MHIHTLKLMIPKSSAVVCEGCDIDLRLATRDEAIFVQQTAGWAPDGPIFGPLGGVVVPADFSLWPEGDPTTDEPSFPDEYDLQPHVKGTTRPDHDDVEGIVEDERDDLEDD